jgi:hypothetical protein
MHSIAVIFYVFGVACSLLGIVVSAADLWDGERRYYALLARVKAREDQAKRHLRSLWRRMARKKVVNVNILAASGTMGAISGSGSLEVWSDDQPVTEAKLRKVIGSLRAELNGTIANGDETVRNELQEESQRLHSRLDSLSLGFRLWRPGGPYSRPAGTLLALAGVALSATFGRF